MNVGVAGRACCCGRLEYEIHMTTGARRRCVHSAQRVSRVPVVIELGNRSNRFPTGGRVTGRARQIQRAVRVCGSPFGLSQGLSGACEAKQEDEHSVFQ